MNRLHAAFPGVTMQDDVFEDDDSIVDDQPTAAASPPRVIRLKLCPVIFSTIKVIDRVTGITSPATSEVPQSRKNKTKTTDDRTNPSSTASRTLGDGFVHDGGLIVENFEMNAGRQRGSKFGNLRVDFIGHRDGVALGLAHDAEQYRGFSVGGNNRIDRLGSVHHRGDIANANGDARGRALDHDAGNLCRGVNLAADQCEDQLMIAFEQPRRIDQIGAANRLENVRDR